MISMTREEVLKAVQNSLEGGVHNLDNDDLAMLYCVITGRIPAVAYDAADYQLDYPKNGGDVTIKFLTEEDYPCT